MCFNVLYSPTIKWLNFLFSLLFPPRILSCKYCKNKVSFELFFIWWIKPKFVWKGFNCVLLLKKGFISIRIQSNYSLLLNKQVYKVLQLKHLLSTDGWKHQCTSGQPTTIGGWDLKLSGEVLMETLPSMMYLSLLVRFIVFFQSFISCCKILFLT